MSENRFDSYVQEKLRGYQKPVFEEKYWDSMEALLDKQDRARPAGAAWKWIVPAAVGMILAVSLAIGVSQKDTGEGDIATVNTNKAQSEAAIALNHIPEASVTMQPEVKTLSPQYNKNIAKEEATVIAAPPVFNTGPQVSYGRSAADKKIAAPIDEITIPKESTSNSPGLVILTPVERIDVEINNIVESSPEPTGKIIPKAKNKGGSTSIASTPWQSILYHFWDNAAYTGMEGKASFNVDDRTKFFPSYGMLERVNHVGVDMQLFKGKAGIGMYYQRSALPFSVNTQTGIMASANLVKIGSGQLRAGFGGEIITQQYSEGGAMRLADRINPALNIFSSGGENKSYSMGAGLNTGLWYSSERLIAGAAMNNFNRPRVNTYSVGKALPSELNLTAGYKFKTAGLEIMPWVEMNKVSEQAGKLSTLVFISYGNKVMIGTGIRNIDLTSDKSEFVVYGGTEIAKRLRVFTSYAYEVNRTKNNIHPVTIHSGVRYRIP